MAKRMKREDFFKLWVEKLRSGEYKKGRSLLHARDNKFCCLGVACDLYHKHVAPLNVEVDEFMHKRGILCYSYDGCECGLPTKLQKYLKLTSLGKLKTKRKFAVDGNIERDYDLAELNDYTGLSFKEIADIIEKEWIKDA